MNTTGTITDPHAPMSDVETKEVRRVFEYLSDYALKAPYLDEIDDLKKWISENKSKTYNGTEDPVSAAQSRIDDLSKEINHINEPKKDKQDKEIPRKISPADVMEMLNRLKQKKPRRRETSDEIEIPYDSKMKKISKREVDEMIWEVDENLDGLLDWPEFKLMYNRNITDRTGLEPSRMVS
jgi:hypothetical protein